MNITIKRATSDGLLESTGEFFESSGYQYCLCFCEGGSKLFAIELSTGMSAATYLIGDNENDGEVSEHEAVELAKAKIKSLKVRDWEDALGRCIDILKRLNYPYPVNQKVDSMGKDTEAHDLLKVPDEVIIKQLRMELGKQASYIQELEDELKLFKSQDIEERKAIRREQLFDEYRAKIRGLEKTIQQLRKDKEGLIIKLNVRQ